MRTAKRRGPGEKKTYRVEVGNVGIDVHGHHVVRTGSALVAVALEAAALVLSLDGGLLLVGEWEEHEGTGLGVEKRERWQVGRRRERREVGREHGGRLLLHDRGVAGQEGKRMTDRARFRA